MNHRHWILDENKVPQPVEMMDWARWFETANESRVVARETIRDMEILTVFLGLDHSWNGPPPLLWETMVFGGPLADEQDRCGGTWQDAEAMHSRMVCRAEDI